MIEVCGVSKRYGNVVALEDVSLSAGPGQVHALVGQNGAGKSTLAKLIVGTLVPDAGEIIASGRCALVTQELMVLPHRTALENVFCGSEPRRWGPFVDGGASRRRYAELAARYRLDVDWSRRAAGLGAGAQRKLQILRALAADCDAIVLDEPTTALSGDDRAALLETVREVADAGTTVVLISHSLSDVRTVADEVTVITGGRKVLTARVADVTSEALLTALLGEAHEHAPLRTPRSAPGSAVLETSELSTERGLDRVTLGVRAGEIAGVAAEDDSAHWLMRGIIGADRRLSGTVTVAGRGPIRSPGAARRAGVGLIPERRAEAMLPHRSVLENARMTCPGPRITQRGQARREVAQLLDLVGLAGVAPSRAMRTLSGGQQQRVLVGRCMLASPVAVLAHNPSIGLDVAAQRRVRDLLAGLAGGGAAILLASSEPQELVELCDRVAVMADGGIREWLEKDELSTHRLASSMQAARAT